MVTVKVSAEFRKSIKPLVKKYKSLKSDYAGFLDYIEANPYAGDDLGDGVHKVRMAIASKNKGKRGGARIITYVLEEVGDEIIVHLLTIYDKSEMESLSDSFIKSLVQELK